MVNLIKTTQSGLILIVDDNTNNLRVLFNLLKKSGFRVLVATDGKNALDKVNQTYPDLILLDVMMPELSGFEVCRQLQSNPNTQEIPVIFMTALSENEDKVKGLKLGAVDYITKPFYQEEVLSRIQLHLKLRSLTQNLREKNKQLHKEVQARLLAETQLKHLNEDLETRVLERTEQLSSALEKLQAREEQLSYEASHDHLTGLYNRLWVTQYLSTLLDDVSSHSQINYGIFFLDLGHFKRVNDHLGHRIGDQVLKEVAERLLGCWRGQGQVARLGGDKFLLVLQICENTDVEAIANRILEHLQLPITIGHYPISLHARIGIIPSILGYRQMTDILRDADIVMSEAKRAGKNGYSILNPHLQSRALERIKLEAELPLAIQNHQFELHYQPIIALDTHQLVGFEALIRWQHPQRGLISPGYFIDLAEETGCIEELGFIALTLACQQLQQWHQQFPQTQHLVINVNLSPLQLQNFHLLTTIITICRQHEILPHQLKLEVTESAFLENEGMPTKILQEIHHQGIKICIDDFGIGYSSLSRLHSFPVNTLKIDRCFISRLDSAEGLAIIQTIISLAHHLGMDLVAEGIETEEQLKIVKDIGCECGQGFLFAKPLNPESATHFIENYRIN
ncbi:MAG: EAL domain-containing protein [Roseofilum sp. SBFL]|uniref:two-component system response regulator n=1 Tax=unclassified Roseofilum TaxID=2620099 RepID=UPI001B29CFBD|nr:MULTISPECIES: EAL domain-containing protein [unclassified Roseofilum]MBP0011525.1 EAL domain-containing protein [Roseofilum sp. SID3]MBP0025704.1 EAL domain-containing protein [Roseofilum sp. SID2]MBP0038463.1 EAL domain-containing protein [Roseofilum sp. SID1]MBP0043226.1 EAL domain-containing protein [Roseofilum sp. SBFL]